MSTDYPEHYPPKENMLWIAMLHFFGNGAKVKKISEINPPLVTYAIAPVESYLAFNDPPSKSRRPLVVLE